MFGFDQIYYNKEYKESVLTYCLNENVYRHMIHCIYKTIII